MTIKSLKHDYFVLVMLEQDVKYDIILASYNNGEARNNIFSIVRVKDIDVVMSLAPFFLDVDYNYFTDFSECFVLESDMYLVFNYAHQTHSEILSSCAYDMKFNQRLKIAKTLLSKLILQRIPYPVMCAILKPENIVVSSDTHISFNYFLVNFSDYQSDCKNKAMVCLGYLFTLLFHKELSGQQFLELTNFVINVQSNNFEDMVSLYKEFCQVFDNLILLEEPEPKRPKSIVERMEEFRSKVLVKFKPALAIIIILIGLYYLYTTIAKAPVPTQEGVIEAIGEFIVK